ncbi:MAG: trypsin-like peptidase domain-containing protein [Anaerolineales bacterium]|nr:trypsin-like peptidase domain-containing protein [Anaerolineales bacterium]
MRKGKPIYLFCFILMSLIFVLTACGGGEEISFSTANIAAANLSTDSAGEQQTTTFAPEDTFFLVGELANAPDDTTLKAEWTAVAVADTEPNSLIDTAELVGGDGTFTFDMTNTNPWPAGDYQVALYLNGELERTLPFEVVGDVAQVEAGSGETAAATETPAEPETERTTGAVDSLEAVKNAVIQIEAQGTFVDPEFGMQYNAAGTGSGFIIDPSGIAVTNNHVVTGAALLKVWVGGEAEPRNAKILGVSECADLAVIDIDGDDFDYLEWYTEPVAVGLDVYAAGFPLGDPEFTLTRGIVSKERADGESDWASVDGVIQHDATINPGNSGGPLVTQDGKIVAVNYAGSGDTNQYFAISQDQALSVIERLKQNEDILSIGVNGQAINDGEGLSGIWVSSVKSGSPADQAGVQSGDIITMLEKLVLATDGTMADYCDILRTHEAEDVLSIEVLRFDTLELLEGQLNGDALVQSFSFADELGDDTAVAATDGTTYANFTEITDDSGVLYMEVPAEWTDIDGSAWVVDGEVIGESIRVSPDIAGFNETWSTPGVFFGATDQYAADMDELLDAFDYSDGCTYDGRTDYQDSLYTGKYDVWTDCGDGGSVFIVLAAEPEDQSFLTLITFQAVTEADLDALDKVLDTFFADR